MGTWGVSNNNGGNGLFEMSGGTLNDVGWLIMTRAQKTLAQTGVLNISGGLINFATGGTSASGGFVANWGTGQTAIINVSGGTIATAANTLGINLNQTGNAANTGILNLGGGLVQVSNVTGSYGIVNFNGGTLRAAGANTGFLTVGSAYVYGGAQPSTTAATPSPSVRPCLPPAAAALPSEPIR